MPSADNLTIDHKTKGEIGKTGWSKKNGRGLQCLSSKLVHAFGCTLNHIWVGYFGRMGSYKFIRM